MADQPRNDKSDNFIKDFFEQDDKKEKKEEKNFIQGVFEELDKTQPAPSRAAPIFGGKKKPAAQKKGQAKKTGRPSNQNAVVPKQKPASPNVPSKKKTTKPIPKKSFKEEKTGLTKSNKKEGSPHFLSKPGKKDKKQNKKNKRKKSKIRRIIKFGLLGCLALCIAGGAYTGVVVARTAQTINDINYESIYEVLSQRSTIYDDKGKKIESVFTEGGNRDNVLYDDLPKNLKDGIVAIEDKTFWDHNGFNFVRIMGAIKNSLVGGGQISGTSTITQQLARNIYLAKSKSERSFNRKIAEAYITMEIEKNLTKEQILEAYLNTIYLGFDTYGVEAAAHAYFNKDVKDLSLLECTSLCALPKSPDAYALVKSYNTGTVSVNESDVLARTDSMVYVYNGDFPKSQGRREFTIKNMVDQGYITQAEADTALGQDLKSSMKVVVDENSDISAYFNDFAIQQVTEDIMEEFDCDQEEAKKRIYTGGLQIYTTMSKDMQKTIEKAFKQDYGYPDVTNLKKDQAGNILAKNDNILLYNHDGYFDEKGAFSLEQDEYNINSDGSLTIYADKRLSFPNVQLSESKDINIDFKKMYTYDDEGHLCIIENGTLSVPPGYKRKDAQGNCIVSAQFMQENANFFKRVGTKLKVSKKNYSIKQKIMQPQSAMVIVDAKSGGVKAMVGGRNINGKNNFNRAMEPRQPGSSIKPLSVYSTGLQAGFNAANNGEAQQLTIKSGDDWGNYITAGSVINDAPISNQNGQTWPKNWYNSYRGKMTLRYAVEQSVNVCAVKVFQQLDIRYPISQLRKMGISTVVESGTYNDMNAAALALGGMTNGISPLEMASAYTIFPNEGKYTEPSAYTKILDSQGAVYINKSEKVETRQVLDQGVAFIMTDILHSVVTNGLGKKAAIKSQPVGGKTGTTTNNFDAWFVGFTPQYAASLWIGNDVNVELTVGSEAATELWSRIMGEICKGTTYEDFPKPPGNVVEIAGEYYIDGTYTRGITRIDTPNAATEKTSGGTAGQTKNGGTEGTTLPSHTRPSSGGGGGSSSSSGPSSSGPPTTEPTE